MYSTCCTGYYLFIYFIQVITCTNICIRLYYCSSSQRHSDTFNTEQKSFSLQCKYIRRSVPPESGIIR